MKTRRTWGMAVAVLFLMAGLSYAQTVKNGEMVLNGDFEANTANTAQADNPGTHDIPGWLPVLEGGAQGEISQDDAVPAGPAGPHTLRLTATTLGTRCGAANSGGGSGMDVRAGSWYDVAFYCRTENNAHTGLVFSLESQNGRAIYARATLPEVGGDWRPYTLSLHAYAGSKHARLVISPIDTGIVWLDGVSIHPRAAR